MVRELKKVRLMVKRLTSQEPKLPNQNTKRRERLVKRVLQKMARRKKVKRPRNDQRTPFI